MGVRSYLYGLAALVGVAISSPVAAQDTYERDCAHVLREIQTAPDEIPSNQFEEIPPNPFCTDEDLDQWRADMDLDPRLILRDPSENFPRWQRSAGTTSHRLELPDAVRFNLGSGRIEFAGFAIGTGSDDQLWRGNDLREYFRAFNQQDFTIRDGDMVYTLEYFLTTAQQEIPELILQMSDILSNFWTDVRGAFGPSGTLIALDFNIFFRAILPQYTHDGVITPDEAREITRRVEQKLEDTYGRGLTPEERTAIDAAVDRFADSTNDMFSDLTIDNLLQPILQDPLGALFLGDHALQDYMNMGGDMLSLMDVLIGENSLTARFDAYARFHGQSDYMSMYYFHTEDGDYIMRHGLLNQMSFLSEVHFRLNAEFHGGRPLRDFAGSVDPELIEAIDQIELLLGYQPVTIDASLSATLEASIFLENLLRDTYEATLIRGNLRYGMGNGHGFVYRFNLDLDSSLDGRVDSFAYQIDAHFRSNLVLREESGQQTFVYIFAEGRYNPIWFGISSGVLWENLSVREFEQHIRLDVVSDFEGNLVRSFENERSDRTFTEQRLTPTLSGAAGLDIGPLGLFMTVRDGSLGTGLYLITSGLTMEARMDDAGHMRIESVGALDGRIDTAEARRFHRDRILQRSSLFPARRAAVWDMTNLYLTNAMHGMFLESGVDLSVGDDPHAGPMLARVGLMFAGDGYIRFGVQGSPDFRSYGTYAGGGNGIFGLTAALLQEQTYGRDSTATSIMIQGQLNIDEISLHLGAMGTMVSPEMARYLQFGRNKFGYTYTLTLEGIL